VVGYGQRKGREYTNKKEETGWTYHKEMCMKKKEKTKKRECQKKKSVRLGSPTGVSNAA
jgi:hypothetical protein